MPHPDTLLRLSSILTRDYKVEAAAIEPEAPLERLGIDSLGAAELMFNLEDEFGVRFPSEPVPLATVADVVKLVDRLRAEAAPCMRRVAVTGVGVVSPLGIGADELIAAARAGRSAVQRWNGDDSDAGLPLALPVAPVDFEAGAHFDATQRRMLDRVSQFALVAARQAMAQAGAGTGAAFGARAGVFVGTGMGGIGTLDEGYRSLYGRRSDRVKPFTVLAGMYHAPAAWIGQEFAIAGPALSYTTACSSSAVAIGEAWQRVADGSLDLALAGGADAPLANGSLRAWHALQTLARLDEADPAASCKPFARDRSGMVLGEGAALLVLEPWDRALARGVPIIGEVLGCGLANDHAHLTRPTVAGQAAALRAALQVARLRPADIDAVNAHGTGTLANDAVETAALKEALGERAWQIPVSATKSMHGHLLGTAGALECVLCLLAMQQRLLLPTLNLHERDPACNLDHVPHVARTGVPVRTMRSSSFAFGGSNAVLALRRAE